MIVHLSVAGAELSKPSVYLINIYMKKLLLPLLAVIFIGAGCETNIERVQRYQKEIKECEDAGFEPYYTLGGFYASEKVVECYPAIN